MRSQTEELTITSRHVPVSVAINDNLTNKPVFIVDQDPGNLINSFNRRFEGRDKEKLRKRLNVCLRNQKVMMMEGRKKKILFGGVGLTKFLFLVLILGRYDINMIKEYFVKNLAIISDVNVA